jgi:hypothetical protein
MKLKLQPKLLIISILTFFGVISPFIIKKLITIPLCTLFLFNSFTFCQNINQDYANAYIPPQSINQSANIPQENLEEIAIPPLIRPPSVNLNFQSAMPNDFRISGQIPYNNGTVEIVMDSPSTGTEQLYTFNYPDQAFALHRIKYRNVSGLDFSQLTGTTSFLVDPAEIQSVLNNFQVDLNNNQPAKVSLANGTYGEFINNQLILKAPNGTILDQVNLSDNNSEQSEIFANKSNLKSNELIAQNYGNSCENNANYNLNNIIRILQNAGNKLAVKNNNTVKNIGIAVSLVAQTLKHNLDNLQTNLPQKICESVVQCGQQQRVEGGQQITTYLFSSPQGSDRRVNLEYEFFTIPDRIQLLYDGNIIFQDGPKSGFTTRQFNLPTNARYVGVRIIAELDNTRWWFNILCSGN